MSQNLLQHRTPISHDQWWQVDKICQPWYKSNRNSYLTQSIAFIKSETRARYPSFLQLSWRVQVWELKAVETCILEFEGCNSCQSKHELHQVPMNSLSYTGERNQNHLEASYHIKAYITCLPRSTLIFPKSYDIIVMWHPSVKQLCFKL